MELMQKGKNFAGVKFIEAEDLIFLHSSWKFALICLMN